jgi:hypothetical protein
MSDCQIIRKGPVIGQYENRPIHEFLRPYADTYFYHATEARCVAAGLKPYQIRKAMEP